MRRLLAGVVALFIATTSLVLAQSGVSVKQSGASVNPNTVPWWISNGVIGSQVTAADSPVTSFGVTSNGSAGICVNSDRITANNPGGPGRNQLCLGAKTSGPATISLQNQGAASPQALNVVINGTTAILPTLSTPLVVAAGGTGATTAAGAQANLGLGTMSTQNANAVAITGGTISGLPNPTNASDAATKAYADALAAGLTIIAPSRLATAAVLPNTPTYSNGASGVGATLTAGSNTTLTVDGTVANLNDVILVNNQAAPAQNGIYTVTTAGGGIPWVLTRATYFNSPTNMKVGSYTLITAGSANINTSWVLSATVTTVGATAVLFNQFSSSSLAANVVANSNLAQMPADTMKANATGGLANPADVTATSFFDAAYCNTIGFLLVRFTSTWTCAKSIAANPVWWGADPTGVSDSATAFNSALAANSQVEFPAGKFKFLSAITYNISSGISSVTIKGAGQDNTVLSWPNAAASGITINYAGIGSSAHIRDLSLTAGATAGGVAITLNYATSNSNPALTAISDIYRVTMRGDDGYAQTDYWSTGINVLNVSNVQFDSVAVVGSSASVGTGIFFQGLPGSSTYAVAFNIAKSVFQNLADGVFYGSFVQGITIDQCNFTADVHGISNGIQTGNLDQLTVVNSQIEVNANGNGIFMNTGVTDTMIANNLFILSNAIGNSINLVGFSHFIISGNTFLSTSTTTTDGIVVGTGSIGTIIGNDISGYGTGIFLQGASQVVQVLDNTISGNTTPVTNSGTGNTVINNRGYNPQGASATVIGASPFTYTAGASPETLYLSGGTITGITVDRNGGALTQAVCNNTSPCTVDLGPLEQAKITWNTNVPTAVKMVH